MMDKAKKSRPAKYQEEWDALSREQQEDQWEKFQDLNARGIADDMYFYQVLMRMHLENYVGH
jgi:hypothetical protein